MATSKARTAAVSEDFVTLLRRHRLARGLTQTELADKLDVVPSTVCFWETRGSLPSPSLIPRLARILGINPIKLTKIIDPDPSSK